jgi:hypothetical protein
MRIELKPSPLRKRDITITDCCRLHSTKVATAAAAADSSKTAAELFSLSGGQSGGYAEMKLRCRMQDDDGEGETTATTAAMRLRNGGGSGAALTVTASVAELTRKVEQTEAQLRTQLRLNLLLVVINLVTLVMVYLYAGGQPPSAAVLVETPPALEMNSSPPTADEL